MTNNWGKYLQHIVWYRKGTDFLNMAEFPQIKKNTESLIEKWTKDINTQFIDMQIIL